MTTILNGPVRLIMLHAGRYDYAEVEIDAPLHLVGPNNVGKTSIIAALQFLYLDEQRQMHFARSLEETRRYYFPDPNSYILFECRTPAGFQVLGVHGLGPLKGYDFERFVYSGRFEKQDFLDDERRILPADEIKKGLGLKSFMRLEPRHLRAALTGLGESRGVDLGLVPLKNRGSYNRFRTVFRNLLRLSHLRQDELKTLILEINASDFQQTEIDLERRYSDNYRRVKMDALELAELRDLEPEIRLLIEQDGERQLLRSRLPVIWEQLGIRFSQKEEELQASRGRITQEIERIGQEEDEVSKRIGERRSQIKETVARLGVLEENLRELSRDQEKFREFVPEWVEKQRENLEKEIEKLGMRLRFAADESAQRVEQRLEKERSELLRHKRLLEDVEFVAYAWLRQKFRHEELSRMFQILNPHLLGLKTGENGDIIIKDEEKLARELEQLLENITPRKFSSDGCDVLLENLSLPDLAAYGDAHEIRERISELERSVRHLEEILEAARDAEKLREQITRKRKERDDVTRLLLEYENYKTKLEKSETWKQELDELAGRDARLNRELEEDEKRLSRLAVARQDAGIRAQAIETEIRRLKESMSEVTAMPPAPEWERGEIADLPEALEDLMQIYRKEFEREQELSRAVSRGLALIEKRTYGKYPADNERAVLDRLLEELEALDERERAVRELWTSIAVGLRSAFKGLDQDLETLKSRVDQMNRALKKVSVSNLARLRLQVAERPEWTKRIREIARSEEMPLFSDPVNTSSALEQLGELLSQHPRVELSDLFDLHFEVHGSGGEVRSYHHLENIESHGTTITIKVLINLILLRGLLGQKSARIPFYLDEVSNLDHNNLSAIVKQAGNLGFTPILASPEAMAVAENIYFITEQGKRVVIEPQSARLRLKRTSDQADDNGGDRQTDE